MPVFDDLRPERFTRSFERNAPTIEDQRLFLVGGPGIWSTSPVAGAGSRYWAQEARFFRKATDGDGNLLTLAINKIGSLLGFDPQAVTIEDQAASQKLLQADINIPFSLAQRDIRPLYREREDPTFNADDYARQWKLDNPDLVRIMEENLFDLSVLEKDINNEQWFRYTVNLILSRIQAEQRIEDRNRRIGTFQGLREAAADNFAAYFLSDPTLAPSLVIPGGAVGKLSRVATSFADDILKFSVKVGRARQVADAGLVAKGAASAIKYIGSAPALVHAGIARRIGHAAAVGTELGLLGAGFAAGFQDERIRNWNLVFEGTENEEVWDWTSVMVAGGLLGAFGFILGGAAGGYRPSRTRQVREGLVASANQNINSRAAKRGFSPDSTYIMAAQDQSRVRITAKIERLAPSTADDAADFAWMTDPEVLADSGLLLHQVSNYLDEILRIMGQGRMGKAKLREIIGEFFEQAKAHNERLRPSIPSTGTAAIRYRTLLHKAEEELVTEGKFLPGTSEFDRIAHARAVGRLQKESDNVLTQRIRREIPVEQEIPSGELNLTALTDDYAELLDKARRAVISSDEEARLIDIENTLVRVGKVDAATLRRGGRVADAGNEFSSLNLRATSPVSKGLFALRKMQTEFQDIKSRLDALRRQGKKTGDIEVDTLVRLRNNLQKRGQRQINKLLADEADLPAGRTTEEIAKDQASSKFDTKAKRVEAITERLQAVDVGQSLLIADIHWVSKIMRAWGLGATAANIALHKTGIPATVRSSFAAIRQATNFIDVSHFRTESMLPSGPVWAGTLADAKRNAEKLIVPLNGFIQRLFETKQIASRPAWIDFQREVILVAHKLKDSTDANILEAVRLWREAAEQIGQEGVDNGKFGELVKDFFPIRVQIGKLRGNQVKFHTALTKFRTQKWLDADAINPDVMVRMGIAKRIDKKGFPSRYEGVGPFKDNLPVSRKAWDESTDNRYVNTMLNSKNARGETAIEESTWRVVLDLLDNKTFSQGRDGQINLRSVAPSLNEFERVIDPRVLLDSELAPFFSQNLMDLSYDYLRTTGFEVKARTATQKLTGVPNSDPGDYFEAVENVVRGIARPDTKDADAIAAGIGNLQAKWQLMKGRSPRPVALSEPIGEFGAEAAIAGTTAVYGSGIGTLIAFTEAQLNTMRSIYHLGDFFSQIEGMFRFIMGRKKFQREVLGDMWTSLRLQRHTSAERFTSGAQGSGFHYRIRDKFLAPWQEFWDTVSGDISPGGRIRNRAAATAISGIKAMGRTMLVAGGTDFFTNYARTMAVVSLKRETAQFLPAALKLALKLEDQAEILITINRNARQTALDAGRPLEVAIREGNKAQHTAWRKLVRESGFGPHWQIAHRFADAGLLNSQKLTIFMDAAKKAGAINRKMIDLTEISQIVRELPANEKLVVEEMINQVHNSMEDVLRKRISEQGPLQTPTDTASLEYHGRALNTMFGFSRSFVDNNVIELAHLPQAEGGLLLGGFVFGEIAGQVARRLLKGHSLDDIKQEWVDNPAATMSRYLLTVPLLGQYTPFLQSASEIALGGRGWRKKVGQSAATSVQNEMLSLGYDAIALPSQLIDGKEPRIVDGVSKLANRMVIGLGAFRRLLGDESMTRTGRTEHSYVRQFQARDYVRNRARRSGDPVRILEPEEQFDLSDFLDKLTVDTEITNTTGER